MSVTALVMVKGVRCWVMHSAAALLVLSYQDSKRTGQLKLPLSIALSHMGREGEKAGLPEPKQAMTVVRHSNSPWCLGPGGKPAC